MAGTDFEKTTELIIVGGGPAGMTAAVYAMRKRLSTLLLSKDIGGQMLKTWGIENYMGYQFITGAELTSKFEEQVRLNEIEIVKEVNVTAVKRAGDAFEVTTEDGDVYAGRSVIIATGKNPRTLGVPGEERLLGRGVTYCATCDGPLFAGKDVAVVRGGNSAVSVALELSRIATRIYVVSRRGWRADRAIAENAEATSNIECVDGYVPQEVKGDKFVESLLLKQYAGDETREIEVQGVFVEIGSLPNSGPVDGLVELNKGKEIIVNPYCETNLPGIFAAGDVTDVPEKQIIVAEGEGAKASLSVFRYISGL